VVWEVVCEAAGRGVGSSRFRTSSAESRWREVSQGPRPASASACRALGLCLADVDARQEAQRPQAGPGTSRKRTCRIAGPEPAAMVTAWLSSKAALSCAGCERRRRRRDRGEVLMGRAGEDERALRRGNGWG